MTFRRIGMLAATTVMIGSLLTVLPSAAATAAPAPAPVKPADAAGGAQQGVQVVRNVDGRLEAFCSCGPTGGPSTLIHSFQVAPSSPFSTWYQLAGDVTGQPSVIVNRDGRLELFVSNSLGIRHMYQLWPGGAWSDLLPLIPGPINSAVAVSINRDGRLELFYQTCPGECGQGPIMHAWQRWAGGPWDAPVSLLSSLASLPIGSVVAVPDGFGELRVIWSSITGTQMVESGHTVDGWWWGAIVGPPGTKNGRLAAGQNADGRLEVFLATSAGVFHAFDSLLAGQLSPFYLLTPFNGGAGNNMAVGRNLDGRLAAFWVDNDGAHVITQVAANSAWAAPVGLRHDPGVDPGWGLAALRNLDGRLEAFFSGIDHNAYVVAHTWQETPNSGRWFNVATINA